jgi:hypothetical protein
MASEERTRGNDLKEGGDAHEALFTELHQTRRDERRIRKLRREVVKGSARARVLDGLYSAALSAERAHKAYRGRTATRYALLCQLLVNVDRAFREQDDVLLRKLVRASDDSLTGFGTTLEGVTMAAWDRTTVRRAMLDYLCLSASPALMVDAVSSCFRQATLDSRMRNLRVTKHARIRAEDAVTKYLRSNATPDKAAIIRRILMAFGYPKRQAMSLFEDFDVEAYERDCRAFDHPEDTPAAGPVK